MAERLQQLGLKFAALFERSYFSNISRYTASVKQATKATTDGAARMSRATNEMTQTVSSSVSEQGRLAQELRNQGVAIGDIAKFLGVSTSAVREWTGATGEAQVATGGLTEGVKKTGQAVRRSSSYLTRYLTRVLLYVTVSRTIYSAVRALNREMREGFKAVYDQTEEYEHLTSAYEKARNAAVLLIVPQRTMRDLMDKAAGALGEMSDDFLRISAAGQAWAQTLEGSIVPSILNFARSLDHIGPGVRNLQMIMQEFFGRELVRIAEEGKMPAFMELFNQRLKENQELLQGSVESTEDYEKALDRIVDAAQRFDKEMERHADKIAEINQTYQVSMLAAGADYYRKAEQIALNEQEKIAEINLDALDRRESALKKFQNRITQLEQRGASQRQANAERHALQMEQRQQRHNLTMAQSERRYQSSRSRLVAEGDTIAIEELDERHRIEEAEREENFRLQQQQAEAMFQLQQRLLEESNRQQIALMRQALMEQLRLIEEQRQERVEEAKETADEERAEAADAAADRQTDARAAQIEALADEEKAHQERLAALGDFLRKLADETGIGIDQMVAIWQSKYGMGSPMDTAIRTAFDRYTGYANAFTLAVQQAIAQAGDALEGWGAFLTGLRPGTRPGTRPSSHQYGGDIIAGGPTQFIAGEGNTPEIVSVRPISPIGGAGRGSSMSHHWQGGAVPVHGTGSLEGVDLSAIGDAIGAGLMSEMRRQGAARVGSMH